MKNLMKAEWFKLSRSFGFKVLCLCNTSVLFSTGILLMAGAKTMGCESLIVALTYILHHAVIGYLYAAVFLCGEFSNRTFGMSLLSGYTRQKIFWTKVLVFLLGFIFLFLIYTGLTVIIMSMGNGFGQMRCQNVLALLLCGILGYAAMGSVIIFIALIAKKTFVAVGLGFGITYALLWVETNLKEGLLADIIKYTYSYQIGQLEHWGQEFSIGRYLTVTVLTSVLALTASAIIFDKIELK